MATGAFSSESLDGLTLASFLLAARITRPLADDIAICLAGDFFRHLKNHFDQCINRKFLRTLEQKTGLAEVFDLPFKPPAGIGDAVAKALFHSQAAGPRPPVRSLGARVAALDPGLGLGVFDAFSPAHSRPVVLIFRGTQSAYLIIVTVGGAPRPGKFVGATSKPEYIHDRLRHADYFRSRLKPGRRTQIHDRTKSREWLVTYVQAGVGGLNKSRERKEIRRCCEN